MTSQSRVGMNRYTQLPRMSQKTWDARAAGGDTNPYSTFRRRRETTTTRPSRPTGPDLATAQLVVKRSLRWTDEGLAPCCEVCGGVVVGRRGWDYSLHHRKGRQGERTDNSPANLLVVCGASNTDGDHGRIHQRASWSRPLGFLLSRNGLIDPTQEPVCIDRESRWVYLGADGLYHDEPPSGRLISG